MRRGLRGMRLGLARIRGERESGRNGSDAGIGGHAHLPRDARAAEVNQVTDWLTDWGEPINFDGENSGPVRQFFLQNACAWLDEYRFDKLRYLPQVVDFNAYKGKKLLEVGCGVGIEALGSPICA